MNKILLTLLAGALCISSCSGETTVTDADKQQIEPAILKSDDYWKHKEEFKTASAKLIKQGKCTEREFKEMGGWVRSVSHKPKPVYFTYCGGMKIANRIYINTETREIFQ